MANKWQDELKAKYSSAIAHGFILHLNTADLVNGQTLPKYLGALWAKNGKDCVAYYNRANGITVGLPTMEKTFKDKTGYQDDPLQSQPGIPKSPGAALPLLERLLETSNNAVIIDHAETLCPEADMAMTQMEDRNNIVFLRRWGQDATIGARGNVVILITSNLGDIHTSIRAASGRYEAIRIPYPDVDTRGTYIAKLDSDTRWTFKRVVDTKTMTRATAGLALIHIEDIYLRAEQAGLLNWEFISERKREVMKSEFAEVLEMMEPRQGFESVGGLENVKKFFTANIIVPMKAGNYGRVPMGVLLTGPAGTGKTIMAEAVAKESGINMAILNPAKIFSKWVGESERNLEKALEAIISLAPVIVFIDEIDQVLKRGEGGDSGVSNRIFKRLMEFTSDTNHRGRVVFLAATNRPDLMDAALKRPGRFDAKIPFLAPDDTSRAGIFRVMATKYNLPMTEVTNAVMGEWVDRTDGWTGAEIERLTIKAKALMDDRDISANAAMKVALTLIRNKTQDIEFMTKVAIDDCDDLEWVPEKYRKLA
jgi:SpoVK/Ycf46/Vps4 family AAA+-type ATPase